MIFSPSILESHIAILGKTGSGKTITAKGIVEYLLRKKERVCIIDPVSAWWGLRSGPSGSGAGFPVVIFGGPRGDIPIGGSHGAAVAEIVATSDTPTIIDMKLMSVKDRTQFFTDFAVTMMQKNQGVLHMIIDEAHLFAPKGKVNSPKAGEMLSETNNLITGGRGVGFRFIMLTQRPAKLHNDCLASIETLVAQRLTLGADRRAVETWIEDCASAEQGREVLASLPKLKTGEGWVWSPGEDMLLRTAFPMITTFDSSNPKNLRRSNVKLSGIDVPTIRLKLEQAAGDAVNDDPVQLKRLLAQAQAELRAKPKPVAPLVKQEDPAAIEKAYQRGVSETKKAAGKEFKIYSSAMSAHVTKMQRAVLGAINGLGDIGMAMTEFKPPELTVVDLRVASDAPAVNIHKHAPLPQSRPTDRPRSSGTPLPAGAKLPEGEVAVLKVACHQRGSVDRKKIRILTGYKRSSVDAYIARLKAKDMIELDGSSVLATQASYDALGPNFVPLPTGDALIEYWEKNLPEGEWAVLEILIGFDGAPVARDYIDTTTGYARSSRDAYIARLKAKQLVEVTSSGVAASAVLFE